MLTVSAHIAIVCNFVAVEHNMYNCFKSCNTVQFKRLAEPVVQSEIIRDELVAMILKKSLSEYPKNLTHVNHYLLFLN